MKFPEKINIVEVGPRDGLQNELQFIPTDIKLQFIKTLIDAGLTYIEATSFVHPKAVPHLADAEELSTSLSPILKRNNLALSSLVPNEKGLERAIASGFKEIAVFTAASEEFNKHNINATIEESFTRIQQIMKPAINQGLKVRGYLSTVIECPYSGKISPQIVAALTKRLLEIGCYQVSLGETIGVAAPKEIALMLEEVLKIVKPEQIALHCHDTYGCALANVMTAMNYGVTTFDSSAGGLGGCPYAPGASGNLATEDLVYFCERQGIATCVDLQKLVTASQIIFRYLGRPTPSKTHQALLAKTTKKKEGPA